MLQRTHDRIPQIRCSAIRALFFVLNPELEADKPIIKEFKRLMEKDSHQCVVDPCMAPHGYVADDEQGGAKDGCAVLPCFRRQLA